MGSRRVPNGDPQEVHAAYEVVVLANKHHELVEPLRQFKSDGWSWQEILHHLRCLASELETNGKVLAVIEETVEAADADS